MLDIPPLYSADPVPPMALMSVPSQGVWSPYSVMIWGTDQAVPAKARTNRKVQTVSLFIEASSVFIWRLVITSVSSNLSERVVHL